MNYDKDIPEFAMQPAKENLDGDEFNEHFDPSPYERLISLYDYDKDDEKEKTEKTEEDFEEKPLPKLQNDGKGNVLVNSKPYEKGNKEKEIEIDRIIVPAQEDIVTEELKMTDIREKDSVKVYIEEDILVPDIKEDLASILSMTGRICLHENEFSIGKNNKEDINKLDTFLLEKTEAYNKPEKYYFVDKIPFLPNGKVDYRKLEVLREEYVEQHKG